MAQKDQSRAEMRTLLEAEQNKLKEQVVSLERRQMEMSAELVHARIDKAQSTQARDRAYKELDDAVKNN